MTYVMCNTVVTVTTSVCLSVCLSVCRCLCVGVAVYYELTNTFVVNTVEHEATLTRPRFVGTFLTWTSPRSTNGSAAQQPSARDTGQLTPTRVCTHLRVAGTRALFCYTHTHTSSTLSVIGVGMGLEGKYKFWPSRDIINMCVVFFTLYQ